MRIWSIHPMYLDSKGLTALWRETLLAKNVLEGNTVGYKNHPQLTRFKNSDSPLIAINQYLEVVYYESVRRAYQFNENKFTRHSEPINITVTRGQFEYEKAHLLKKLKTRDFPKFIILSKESDIDPHPLFRLIEGDIEEWEKV